MALVQIDLTDEERAAIARTLNMPVALVDSLPARALLRALIDAVRRGELQYVGSRTP